jgi:hypothetical protein
MRGKKARAIRKAVYGGRSSRPEGRGYYATKTNPHTWFNHPDSLRRQYQRAKAVR